MSWLVTPQELSISLQVYLIVHVGISVLLATVRHGMNSVRHTAIKQHVRAGHEGFFNRCRMC